MARLPEWVYRLQHSLYPYVIPFSFGPRPRPGQFEIHSATAFLLDLGAIPLLITAGHVMDQALQELASDPSTLIMLGNHRVVIDPADVKRAARDLAAVALTDRLAAKLEGNYQIVRPPTWPPHELHTGDPVIVSGFPGPWRLVTSSFDVDFRAIISLALIHSVNEEEFLCHVDPAYLEERAEPTTILEDDLPEARVGGLSGAPGFLVRNQDPKALVIPQLCGIVKEGGGSEILGAGHRLIYFTRLDRLRPDGRM